MPGPSSVAFAQRVQTQIGDRFFSLMDHYKPQAALPQVHVYDGEQYQLTNDADTQHECSSVIDEPAHVEDRRERRGESVW